MAIVTKIPVNSRPLYRILTEKSRLGFGQYGSATIGWIMAADEDYLVWLYANNPQIALCQSILDKIGLRAIPKPGTDENVLKEYRERKHAQYNEEQTQHFHFRVAQIAKKKAIKSKIKAQRAEYYTKGQLQAINHGHGNPKLK